MKMQIRAAALALSVSFGLASMLFIFAKPAEMQNAATAHETHDPGQAETPPYHSHPPSSPLPSTLELSQFAKTSIAFVAYSIAAKIRPILYQMPCYCHCDRDNGHKSLLDCYTGHHGEQCATCQKEIIFCFERHKRGISVERIRQGIAEGKAWPIDVSKYSDGYSENQAGVQK